MIRGIVKGDQIKLHLFNSIVSFTENKSSKKMSDSGTTAGIIFRIMLFIMFYGSMFFLKFWILPVGVKLAYNL